MELIERRPAVISAQEERQRDSEIKVTGKEQFHRSGLSRRWMCNMSGWRRVGWVVGVGGWRWEGRTIYSAKCQLDERFAVSALTPPVTRRSSIAVETLNIHPDETQSTKAKQGAAELGKRKRIPPPPLGLWHLSRLSTERITWEN